MPNPFNQKDPKITCIHQFIVALEGIWIPIITHKIKKILELYSNST